jgi:hypothetical protein
LGFICGERIMGMDKIEHIEYKKPEIDNEIFRDLYHEVKGYFKGMMSSGRHNQKDSEFFEEIIKREELMTRPKIMIPRGSSANIM